MGEHLPCKQGVRSSNLLISTKPKKSAKNLENYIDIEKKQTNKKQTIGQDNKGIRRMPWHQESKKDGTSTEMLRGAANRL